MPHTGRLVSAALLLFAVGVRVPVLLRPNPINIDEARYLVAAHHLRSGIGYSDWRGPEIDIHPLHPALVAVLGRSIGSLEARGRGVTFTCSLLLLWPLGVLARRLAGPKAAVVCLLLAASSPWLVRASASAQPESLYVLLTTLAMVSLWPGMLRDIATWRWTLSGALFGMAYLARPEGLLVGVLSAGIVLLFGGEGFRRERLLRFGAFAAALLAFGSPYLLFLRSATGSWTVTGKTGELFFVGQSLYDSGGVPPDVSTYVTLMERWGGVMPFIRANPGTVALRAASNVMEIGVRALPRALGPAGMAGLLACAVLLFRQRGRRRSLLFALSPALTLLLMLFTFRNDRVIASVLPFLLVASAAGLVALAERWDLLRGRRLGWALTGLATAIVCALLPAASRAARSQVHDASLDHRASDAARRMAGGSEWVASNNPALSFYMGDPSLFGPPGNYVPLPWLGSCHDFADALRERRARIAILDGSLESGFHVLGSEECPLREAMAFEDRAADRRIVVLAWK